MKKTKTSFFEQLNESRTLVFAGVYFILLLLLGTCGYMIGREQIYQYNLAQKGDTTTKRLTNMSLNMRNASSESRAVKMEVSIEVETRDKYRVQNYIPLIMDRINTVLNHTPVEQLTNKADLHLVRENLLYQINEVSGPVRVQNLYINKLLATN